MKEYRDRLSRILSPVLVAIIFLVISAAAQDDQNPNSPTPVLLSTNDSSRVLAVNAPAKLSRGLKSLASPTSFPRNGKAVMFVTNIRLMKDEDHTAFRVYAEDGMRRLYR